MLLAMLAWPLSQVSDPLDVDVLARHLFAVVGLLDIHALRHVIKPDERRFTAGNTIDRRPRMQGPWVAQNITPCGTSAVMEQELRGVVVTRVTRFNVYGVECLKVLLQFSS